MEATHRRTCSTSRLKGVVLISSIVFWCVIDGGGGGYRLPVTGWVGRGVFRSFSSASFPCVVNCSSLLFALEWSRSFSFFLFLFSLGAFSVVSSNIREGGSVARGSREEKQERGQVKTNKDQLGTVDIRSLKGKSCKYININVLWFICSISCLF